MKSQHSSKLKNDTAKTTSDSATTFCLCPQLCNGCNQRLTTTTATTSGMGLNFRQWTCRGLTTNVNKFHNKLRVGWVSSCTVPAAIDLIPALRDAFSPFGKNPCRKNKLQCAFCSELWLGLFVGLGKLILIDNSLAKTIYPELWYYDRGGPQSRGRPRIVISVTCWSIFTPNWIPRGAQQCLRPRHEGQWLVGTWSF